MARTARLQKDEDRAAAVAQPGATRVSLNTLEANIAATTYLTGHTAQMAAAQDGTTDYAGDVEVPMILERLKSFTICMLIMRNGFVIIGKSAPADPANYNEQLGRDFAYEDAVRQAWQLLGFQMSSHLATMPPSDPDAHKAPSI
jgi:hypothetical protein